MPRVDIKTTLAHMLPNQQILNFHDGTPTLPDWVPTQGLRLMMGAGDLDHYGMPNIEYFNTYDVFLCEPWDWNGSLIANVNYLLAHQPNKLLCFIDARNWAQVEAFATLFKERFAFIDGHGGHCPHFEMTTLQKLLQVGGTAANVYERAECVITNEMLENWLNGRYVRNGISNIDMITGPMFEPENPELTNLLRTKIIEKASICKRVNLGDLELSTKASHELRDIMRQLMFETSMPFNLRGTSVNIKKDWRHQAYDEFIVTKIPFDAELLKVANFEAQHGSHHPHVVRANSIIQAIHTDLDNGIVFGANAKYNTLQKHIQNNLV